MQTILLIEAHAILRETLALMLSFQGYQVIEAEDGVTGMQSAIESCPDLIVCDLELPKLTDGFEVLASLRHNPQTVAISIVVLTAWVYDEARLEAMQLGVDAYLFKPCPFTKLLAEIQHCFAQSKYRLLLPA